MSQDNDTFDNVIRSALRRRVSANLPCAVDVWPTVQAKMAARSPRRLHFAPRAILIAACCLTLVTAGLTGALAASPATRHILVQALPFNQPADSIGFSPSGEMISVHPAPTFDVFYPAIVPQDLPVRGGGHLLTGGFQSNRQSMSGFSYTCLAAASKCPNVDLNQQKLFPPAPSGAAFVPALLSPLVEHGVETVWFGFHAFPPASTSLLIAEWNVSTMPVPPVINGTTVGGQAAALRQEGKYTILTLVRNRTAISIETNQGLSTAMTIAGHLQPKSVS